MQKSVDSEINSHLKNKSHHKEIAIFAMFLNRKNVKNAVKSLTEHGFLASDIKVLSPEKNGSRDFVYHLDTNVKTGLLIGAAVGFILLGMVGIIIGANNRIQLGMQSWIMNSTLAALGGLIFGAAAGALVGVGIPKPAAGRYKFYLKEGGLVVMMHLKSEEDKGEAHFILESAGGQDITILEESQIWSAVVPENKKLTFH